MDARQVRVMKVVLLTSSLASLGVLAAAAYRENFKSPYRTHQQAYKELLARTARDEMAAHAAAALAVGPKQLYLPELAAVDRCTSCHLGVENPAAVDAAQPLRRHPGEILAQHPPDKFGCVVCHQGQGRAISQEQAHGWTKDGKPVPHVDTPLLRKTAVYTNCGRCHMELDLYGGESDLYAGGSGETHLLPGHVSIPSGSLRETLPGADTLAEGKRLVTDLGCLGCHKYRGRGGVLGPDLTYVGDKTRHDFDFTHVKGERTVEQWLYEHFMIPSEVSPGTSMPEMGLSPQEGRALALYMMSMHRKEAPASHTPRPRSVTASYSEPVRGETLYRMFCSACHGPDGYGTTMRGGLWPKNADPWGRNWDDHRVVTEVRDQVEVLVPSLNHADTLATMSDDFLRQIITVGRPGTKMPAWGSEGGLTSDEITLLVEYLRGWQRPMPGLVDVSAARGNPRIGAALYRANCAACHGTSGEGGIGASLNSPTFLAIASDAFLRDTIVNGRPNTAMPAWREFNVQELSDLLAWLRQWQPTRAETDKVLALCAGPETAAVSARVGGILYNANCVMCHGQDGGGDLGPTLNTQAFLTVVPDRYLIETLVQGRPGTGMPSWHHFSNEDVASIVRHMRTWQTEPAKDAEWHQQEVARGDWDTGATLFAGMCASCHGPQGEGSIGPQLNNPVFLRTASDVMLREWIAYGKEGTPMLGFRRSGQGITELTDRQIEDLVTYLRRLQRMGETELPRVSKSPHGRPERGEVLYAGSCAACHGDQGEGASGPALANPNFLKFASDGFLMATMAMGRTGTEMRPVKRGPQSILDLSSDEINDIVAYLRSLENQPPAATAGTTPIPHRFVVPWDLARGRDLYTSNCAGCHGDNGKGSWAPELNNEGFLGAVTDGALQATIVLGRKGTAMRPFGIGGQGLSDLSPQDIDDIVAYIRHWSKLTPPPLTVPAERSLTMKETQP